MHGHHGVARSFVLAQHLYASPLASCLRTLLMRSRDMSGTNMVLWPGTCPARPSLRYTTDHSRKNKKKTTKQLHFPISIHDPSPVYVSCVQMQWD